MTYKDYTSLLLKYTSEGKFEYQLKFAISVCKKLYFDYQKFTEVYEWGDANLLMDAIKICQQAIENPIDKNQLEALITEVDLIIPDMDDFGGTELGSYALNASAAVAETIGFIVDHDKIHIYNIGTCYTDTIDFKIQESKDLTELEIENHPLMIEAWNFIIEEVKSCI
jgi:uncharacterized protein YjaG (DUF416 family)